MKATSSSTPPVTRNLLFTLGFFSILGVLVASFLAWNYFLIADYAAQQPGCPTLRDTVMAWCFVILTVIAAAVAMVSLGVRRVSESLPIGLLILFLALPVAGVLATGLDRARRGALGVYISSNFRFIGQARSHAESEGSPYAETLLLSIYERSITPEIIINSRWPCPYCPPMPSIEEFNYASITMDDALTRRVTREQITEAVNATLGDAPWEHIGWTWFIRDARPYAGDLDQSLIVGGGVLYMYGGMRAVILHADSSVVFWQDNDRDLREKYEAALAASEAAGVAPPPDELRVFVEGGVPVPRAGAPGVYRGDQEDEQP